MAEMEELYGLLPIASSLGGSFFMMVVYGFILLQGANFLSDGSEMLLEVFSPGLIGGLVLPTLGALPDCLIIVVSGLGDPEDAKDQVKVGLGTLAGSTIMLLTIAWSGSLLLGRCDLDANGIQKDKTLTRSCDLGGTGVSVDKATAINAAVMAGTSLLYLVVHIPSLFGLTKDPAKYPHHAIPSIVGFSLCFVSLIVYIIYQIMYPELRRHVMRSQRLKMMRFATVKKFAEMARSYGGLVTAEGEISKDATDKIFEKFDADANGHIDVGELRALLVGLDVAIQTPNMDEDVDHWMKEFDCDKGGHISKEEFHSGIQKWVAEKRSALDLEYARRKKRISAPEDHLVDMPADSSQPLVEHPEDDDDDDEEQPLSPRQIVFKACCFLAIGTFIAAFFADAMVESVTEFATASKIPAFIVAFVVTPLASNASELVSSLKFAMRKKKKNISMTYSQVYGAVTMNNTLCLGLFLLVVYAQKLTWNYSAEVTVIVIPTIIVGILGMSKTTFQHYLAYLVLLLYPLAVGGVFFLENVLGLD